MCTKKHHKSMEQMKKGTLQFKEKSCIPGYHPKHQPKGDLNLLLHDPLNAKLRSEERRK
jgi:hypothetical protein